MLDLEEMTLVDPALATTVAVTGALAAAIGWLLWRLGLAQPFLALFVRVAPSEAADHVLRAAVLEELGKKRVNSTEELQGTVGANRGTLLWHLRILERLEVVRSRRVGRIRVWYLTAAAAPTQNELLVDDAPQRRSILDAVEREPGISLSELSRRTGLPKSNVHRNVAKMATAGILELRREALRTCIYRASS